MMSHEPLWRKPRGLRNPRTCVYLMMVGTVVLWLMAPYSDPAVLFPLFGIDVPVGFPSMRWLVTMTAVLCTVVTPIVYAVISYREGQAILYGLPLPAVGEWPATARKIAELRQSVSPSTEDRA